MRYNIKMIVYCSIRVTGFPVVETGDITTTLRLLFPNRFSSMWDLKVLSVYECSFSFYLNILTGVR